MVPPAAYEPQRIDEAQRTMAHVPEPDIPAPSGKYASMRGYIEHAVQMVGGSANSLADVIGLTSGSRVSNWRKGYGMPSVLMALRLAKLTGDDPRDVLTMAGHEDVVRILNDIWAHAPPPDAAHLAKFEAGLSLEQAKMLIERAIEVTRR